MRFCKRVISFPLALILLLSPVLALATVPTATGVYMTGSMKRLHTLTVFYTYFDADGEAESGTTFQWFRYDDNCGTNPVAIAGATTSSYVLAIADQGKHIGVQVTPRDVSGEVGTPVLYQPWSCAGSSPAHDIGPNVVLANGISCTKADGVGPPTPGNLVLNETALCSPRSLDWQIEFTGINYSLAANRPARIIVDWGDGNIETVAPTLQNTNETNMAKQVWRATVSHTFDYDGGSTASTTVDGRCTYTMRNTWGTGTYTGAGLGTVTSCLASGSQSQLFTVWDMEDNTSLGQIDVNHVAGTGGIEDGNPVETTEICEDDQTAIRLEDASDFNCTNPLETFNVNDQGRWIQWVYGTTGSNVTTGAGADERIIINGVSYTLAQMPVYGKVTYQPASTTAPLPLQTDNIVMPTSATPGQVFMVTMRSWNTCNAFDNITVDGNGLNPNQATTTFNIRGGNYISQADIANVDPFYAHNNPVTRQYTILIIDSPNEPVGVDKEFCYNTSLSSGTGSCPATCTNCFELTAASVAGSTSIVWYTADPDLGGTPVVNPNGTNCRFFPASVSQGGIIPTGSISAGAEYRMWAKYVISTGCESPATDMLITKRTRLSQPPAFVTTAGKSPTQVCNNSTNVVYEVGNIASIPALAFPGSSGVAYRWLVRVNDSPTFSAIPGVTITPQADGVSALVNFNVTDATFGAASSLNLVVRIQRFYTTNTTNGADCNDTFRDYPITLYRETVGGTLSPGGPLNLCEGQSVGNITLSGFIGTIQRWEVSTNGGTSFINAGLGTGNPVNPGVLPPGSYIYRAVVQNGTCLVQNSSEVTVVVSADPGTPTTGANQAVCGPLTSGALGGNAPSAGTGTWSQVSGPGTVTFNPNANTPNATATVSTQGLYVLRWTFANGTCVKSADVSIDIGTDPGAQDAGPAGDFCGTTGVMAAVPPSIGTGTWTQIGGPVANNTTFSNVNNPTSNISLNTATYGVYTYRWTVVSGTCAAQIDDVTITFREPPTATPMASFTTCVDETLLTAIPLTGTIGGGATQGRWEVVSGSGTMTSNNTTTGNFDASNPITDSYKPVAADFAAGSAQLRLATNDPAGACTSVSSTITITFDRRPNVVNAGPDQAFLCADNPATTLAASAPNHGGTGTWSGPAGVVFGNVNQPNSTVSNLPAGLTTLTWTVSSALSASPGGCTDQSDQVDITVNALPAALDPAPSDLCETNEGTGIAQAVDLTAFNDDVTGIVGSTNRNVRWFSALPRIALNEIATPTSFNVANGQVLYTTVVNTLTNCDQDGQVTFTINALPAAIDQVYGFCEEFPAGSGQVNNVDLTTAAIKNDIVGAAVAALRTITWFNTMADATANINPIATPNDIDLAANRTVFARVFNNTSACVNFAQVDLVIKPRPADPTIDGSTNQCVGNFDLYNIIPVVGATYTWDVDDNAATEFNVLSGGGVNDFLVVLEFPNVYTGDVRVTVNLNGCSSNQIVKTVAVDATPPAVTIAASDDPVCENQGGVVYTATSLPNTDYTWGVPGVTGTIIGGQGTNQVTVNIGSLSGNIQVTPQTQGGNCPGNPAAFFIDVRERPAMATNLNKEVCSDVPIAVTLDDDGSVPAMSFNITNVTIPPGLSPSSRPTGTGFAANAIFNHSYENVTGGNLNVRYTVVPVSVDGCEGSPLDIFVTIKPEPTLDPNLNKTICSQSPTGINLKVATGSFPADQFQITSINANGLTSTAGTPVFPVIGNASEIADDAWRNQTGAPVTVEYFVRPINSTSTCIGDPPLAVLVTVEPEPVVTPATETICSGDSPTLTLASHIPGSTFTWTVKNITGGILGASNGTGANITNVLVNNGAVAGTVVYEVKAKAPLGVSTLQCEGEAEDITITVNPAPSATNITQTVCSDAAGGNTSVQDLTSFESTVNAGAGLTFSWFQDLALTMPINAPQVNAYSLINNIPVYVEIDNGLCTNVASVTFTVNPLPAVTATAPQFNGFEITCENAANGQINATANSGTGPYLFSIDGGTTYFPSGTFNSLAPGAYTIRTRDSKGCEANSMVININQPNPVVASPGALTNVNCKGASTGVINVIGMGGVGGFTFSLNGSPFQASSMFTGLTAGTYTIAVRDANGCTDTEFVTLTEPAALVGSVTAQTNVNCNGNSTGSITVDGSGGTGPYEYSLNGNPFQASGTFSGLAAGSYTVTVRDVNTCTVPVSITISQPSILSVSLTAKTDVSCNGGNNGSITVLGSGGTSPYEYNIGSGFQVSGTFSALTANNYTITVRDNNGCMASIPVSIVQPPALTGSITSQTNVLCFGGNSGMVTVNGGGGTGTYMYAIDGVNFTNSGTFTGLAMGAYTITVRDQNNCTITVPVNITEPTQLTATLDAQTDVVCHNGASGTATISAVGGTGPYQFSINGGTLFLPSGSFTGLSAGSYTVIVRDNNLCTTNVNFTINQPAALSGNVVSKTNVDCKNAATGVINVAGAGGTLPYEFSLNGGPFQASATFNGLTAGTYTIRVRDGNLCTADFTTTITEPTQVAIAIVTSAPVDCNGNSTGSVVVAGSGGTGSYTYSLVPQGDPPGAFAAPATFTSLAAGAYTIYVHDANNCEASVDVTITQPDPLTLSAQPPVDVLCFNQNTGSITVQAAGGTTPYEYSLNGSPFTPLNVFTSLAAGSYNIVARDFNGCLTAPLNVMVSQPAQLTASAVASSDYNGFDVSCFNEEDGEITVTSVGGTGAHAYLLLQAPSNATGAANGIFTGVRAGNYTVRVTDANGCSFTTPVLNVTQPFDIDIDIEKPNPGPYAGYDISCVGASDGQVTVTNVTGTVGATQFTLSLEGTDQVTQATTVFNGLVQGVYTVRVEDANGCTKSSLPVVLLDPLPLFEGVIGLDQAVCLNQGAPPQTINQLAPVFGGIETYTYSWEESTDNVNFTAIAATNTATFTPPAGITQTTFYRRRVTSGSCASLVTNTVKVTVNPLPTASLAAPNPVCEDDFFILDFNFTGTAPFYFTYNDGGAPINRIGAANTPVPVLNFTTTKTYTVTSVRDFNGCEVPAALLPPPVTVNVSRIDPTFSISSAPAQCSGSIFTFQWNVDADVEYTWIWGDGTTTTINANTLAVGVNTINHTYSSSNTAGNTTFPVILTAVGTSPPFCGPKQSNQSVTILPAVIVNVQPDDNVICSGQTVKYTNLTQGASTIEWFYHRASIVEVLDQRFSTDPFVNYTYTNLSASNPIQYVLEVRASNTSGCQDAASFTVDVFRGITPLFDEGTVPPFSSGQAIVDFTNTSTPLDNTMFQYDWTYGSNATPVDNSDVMEPSAVTYTTPGFKTITLTAINRAALLAGENCVSKFTKVINILVPPLNPTFTVTPLASCLMPPPVELTTDVLDPNGGDKFEWELVDQGGKTVATSNLPEPVFRVVNPGVYSLTMTISNTATAQSETHIVENIEVFENPIAAFEARPTTLFVPDTELTTFNFSTGANFYEWDFGDGGESFETEPNHFYRLEGQYTIVLTAINDHGLRDVDGDGVMDSSIVCKSTAERLITAKQGGLTKIPNAFTPNPNGPSGGAPGNGTFNDVFLPITKGVDEFTMQVFDRWGNLVFESRDKNHGWDGYDSNGNLLPAGVYVYKLTLRLADGQRTTQIGDVTLIR